MDIFKHPMISLLRVIIIVLIVISVPHSIAAQDHDYATYCNPIDIDYTYMIYNAHNGLSYRSGADPAVVEFQDEYYLFVTRSMGYWHSTDLENWSFITPEKWYFEGSNAPAAHNYKDSVLYMTGNPSGSMSILYTDDPKAGKWKAIPSILNNLQDPDLFVDDDGSAYMFWGSSNKFPVRGKALDRSKAFKPGETVELFNLEEEKHGWERFGENHTHPTLLEGYIEGPWLTKHDGRYYMQYAAPGTEWNVYGDGVYTSDHPLGPYEYAPNNPVSYKPGGFANGAGHGSTVVGPQGRYWHFGTMAVGVNIGWERRISMFPTAFDSDGLMTVNTRFGDYPHYGPAHPTKAGEFTGWMLLSYGKPVTSSGEVDGFLAQHITDEDVKTFWVAEANDDTQWVQLDLGSVMTINAIQVNYNDYQSDMYGRFTDLYHRYTVEVSSDGARWSVLVDKSESYEDAPNDYTELPVPVTGQYVRYTNKQVPTPYLSISDLRVFGRGTGNPPKPVKNLVVSRKEDRRDVDIQWNEVQNALGYNVRWGIAPDKLYSSWLIYGDSQLEMKSLSVDQSYYFRVEAFNENGISKPSTVVNIE